VALADEHARVVDRLGEALLEHERLQAALEEVLGRQRQHIIELVLRGDADRGGGGGGAR
jgi:hypothetical protein